MSAFNFPAGYKTTRTSKHAAGRLTTDEKAARNRRQRQKMKQHKRRFRLN